MRTEAAHENHSTLLAARHSDRQHQRLRSRARSNASTLVACALRFDRATVAHVGDSRCYLIRDGRPLRLTRDHTAMNDQARLGFFPGRDRNGPSCAAFSPAPSEAIFSSLPEISEHHVIPGDLLLLCSDGLHGAVSDDKIARIATPRAT